MNPWQTLVSADQLASALSGGEAPAPVVFDCSFDLADTDAGRKLHAAARIPGSIYLHLDKDLSGPKSGRNGRHPLPARETFAATMRSVGVDDDTRVVAYDNAGGVYASRLWWMLRWAGHRKVAVLDGGFATWKAAGHPTATTPASAAATTASTHQPATAPASPGRFTLREPLVATISYADLRARLGDKTLLVIDARSPDRFRGENETLDPIGGHIPGAANRFFRDNLAVDGRFKPAAELRQSIVAITGDRAVGELVHQCGSGVTACHNLLAMEVAGLSGAALYPGSWSEWCAQPDAQIATGQQ